MRDSYLPGGRPPVPAEDRPGGRRLVPPETGLGRSIRLLRLFRSEQANPEWFYTVVADDAVQQVLGYCELAGRTVLDIGGGGGWFAEAFWTRGARCCVFEPDPAELQCRKTAPVGAVIADGLRLPVRDGAADVTFSSNVLEHVADPMRLISEMIRVTRQDGLIYLGFTNWYSPWGGHEMSPWHYLGSRVAERRYVRRHQRKPKHVVGTNLFPVHVGYVLRELRARADIEIVDARPRYYPSWCRPLVAIPGLREVATWNLMVVMRRTR
jgi:SAM-dependent methyltransferase